MSEMTNDSWDSFEDDDIEWKESDVVEPDSESEHTRQRLKEAECEQAVREDALARSTELKLQKLKARQREQNAAVQFEEFAERSKEANARQSRSIAKFALGWLATFVALAVLVGGTVFGVKMYDEHQQKSFVEIGTNMIKNQQTIWSTQGRYTNNVLRLPDVSVTSMSQNNIDYGLNVTGTTVGLFISRKNQNLDAILKDGEVLEVSCEGVGEFCPTDLIGQKAESDTSHER